MKKFLLFSFLFYGYVQNSLSEGIGLFAPKNVQTFANFMDVMSRDEIKSFTNNKGSLLGDEVVGPLSASQIISMYNKNELAANKKLKGKPVRIRTVAAEIGESFDKQAYIRATGKNPFESINLIVDGKDERILNMSKGSKVDMVCYMQRYVMHTPFLGNCEFSSDYAKATIKNELSPEDISKPTFVTSSDMQRAMIMLYKADESRLEVACKNANDVCVKEVDFFAKNKDKYFEKWAKSIKPLQESHKEDFLALFGSDFFKNKK